MLWHSAKALLAQRERARSEDLRRQLKELAERTHVAMARMYSALSDVELAMVDGHLEDAWARFNGLAGQADELGMSVRVSLQFLMAPTLYLGRAQRFLEACDHSIGPATVAQPDRQSPTSSRLTAGRALCLAQVGRIEEARTLVAPLLNNVEGMDDEFPFGTLALLLRGCC
jgi:hypothetical protein